MKPDDKEIERIRDKIIKIYLKNVHGKKSDAQGSNKRHDGSGGHWLENQMGIRHNASNTPDLFGHEMKNYTTSKTSFGDWSANYYIFKDKEYGISRDDFLRIFGHPNEEKGGRNSWSGKPVPKIGTVNSFGQELVIDKDKNILALYHYSKDQRKEKASLVPKSCQIDGLVIARWNADGKKSLKEKVENKFDQMGWFKCLKNKDGIYHSIVFGNAMNFETWIKYVSTGDIFFDSGMYAGNIRPYSQWRANNSLWDKLVVSRHP